MSTSDRKSSPVDDSRRRFIQTSAVIGGALLVRVALPHIDTPNKRSSAANLNAYIQVHSNDRITIVMPKVEMGQGTCTSLPMLVAEELEFPFNRIDLVAAPPAPDVYGFDGDQSTGGSTTIRVCWIPLRKAGAAARVMLIEAAAKRWGVDSNTCHAQDPGGRPNSPTAGHLKLLHP